MLATYYLLFRSDGVAKVADATRLIGTDFPRAFTVGCREYRIISDEDTFIFWDEWIDSEDRTLGFTFVLPCSRAFQESRLITASTNVSVADKTVSIDLLPATPHKLDCIQGFGSEVYRAADDAADCAILMFNWSGRQAGFELTELPMRAIA